MATLMKEASRTWNPPTFEVIRNVTFSQELAGGPTRSDWRAGQTIDMFGQGAAPARISVSQESAKVLAAIETCGLVGSGSSISGVLMLSLVSRLQTRLNGLIGPPATWRTKVTPSGRWLFRLTPSEQVTVERGSGLLPTPTATDWKGAVVGEALEKRRDHPRGVRLEEHIMRLLPSPTAGSSHSSGRLDEWGGKNRLGGTVAGRQRLNPSFVADLMGYPEGWANCAPTAMPSSRK